MKDVDYKFEKFEEYFGEVEDVEKILNECKMCGAQMVQSHMTDYGNLIIKESSTCPDCGLDKRKLIHSLN